jgi:hypothetical protein
MSEPVGVIIYYLRQKKNRYNKDLRATVGVVGVVGDMKSSIRTFSIGVSLTEDRHDEWWA